MVVIRRFTRKDRSSDGLACRRTQMAADRTLLAWVRTGMSFISFGFTLYKILDAAGKAVPSAVSLLKVRPLGMLLLFMGTVPLAVAMIEYYKTTLDLGGSKKEALLSGPFVLGASILVLGTFLSFNVVFRWNLP
jgi:putative membrane protein